MTNFTPSPELFPFPSRRFETAGGVGVHYVDEGRGRPILMCHGNPTWSFLYRDVIARLRDEFRCVALDYPGFGLSDRPAGYGYTAQEHAAVVTELVRALDLRDAIVMGHDWGGPIGLAAACADPDRFSGVALGNTWFWPADRRARMFSRVMSSRPLQRAILRRNLFVERVLPAGLARTLTDAEFEHYRAVQPSPEARVGVARLPREIVAARPLLERLDTAVPELLGDRRALVTFPMRDAAFPARTVLPRLRAAFADVEVVELPGAKHFVFEDAPDEVAAAVRARFGS